MTTKFEDYRKELAEHNLSTFEDLVNLVQDLAKDACKIILKKPKSEDEYSQLFSHFGGDPYFEKGEQWPGMEIGSPATFICQVFNEKNNNLPDDIELIQFFYDYDYGPSRSSQNGWYIKIYTNLLIHDLEYMSPPKGIRKTKFCPIVFKSVKSLPSWEELKFRSPLAFKLSCVLDEETPWRNYHIAARKVLPETGYRSQIGGYPQWLQSAQIPIREDSEEFQFIMQIDSEDDAGLMWRDMGLVYLFWDEESEDTRFILQSC